MKDRLFKYEVLSIHFAVRLSVPTGLTLPNFCCKANRSGISHECLHVAVDVHRVTRHLQLTKTAGCPEQYTPCSVLSDAFGPGVITVICLALMKDWRRGSYLGACFCLFFTNSL